MLDQGDAKSQFHVAETDSLRWTGFAIPSITFAEWRSGLKHWGRVCKSRHARYMALTT